VAATPAPGGPLFAAYVITHSSTLEGIVVGVPLMAAGGFAIRSSPNSRKGLVSKIETRP
jgi:hypothetical protein